MHHVFENYFEAQRFANAVSNVAARAALRGVHTLILEAGGAPPLHFLPERYSPIQLLDILIFYKVVERLFAGWTDEFRAFPEVPGNRDRISQLQEAKALISTLPT